jgi:hypothetical protein
VRTSVLKKQLLIKHNWLSYKIRGPIVRIALFLAKVHAYKIY